MRVGVDTPRNLSAFDPRQERFITLYCDVDSATFGNCYQAALKAGYTKQTARNLTHNRPAWLSEKLGQMPVMEPEALLLKLTAIVDSSTETTQNRLRAIDMMMKYYHMLDGEAHSDRVQINIQNVLD